MPRWMYACLLAVMTLLGGVLFVYEAWWDDYSSMSHYEVLGVAPTTPVAEIKRAYRELSLQYHPDKDGSEIGLRRFHRVSDAYQVLSKTELREAYDIELEEQRRIKMYQRNLSWQRIRSVTSSRNIPDILWVYLVELPQYITGWLLHLLKFRYFVSTLIAGGTMIFVLDLVSHALSPIIRALSSNHTNVSKEFKDISLQAARSRQQEAMDSAAATLRPRPKLKAKQVQRRE